jgi:hypothetical protein
MLQAALWPTELQGSHIAVVSYTCRWPVLSFKALVFAESKKAVTVTTVILFVSHSNHMILAALLNRKNDVIESIFR